MLATRFLRSASLTRCQALPLLSSFTSQSRGFSTSPPSPPPGHEVKIDTSTLDFLRKPDVPDRPLPTSANFSTALEQELYNQISLSGPISLSRYINLALTHPLLGYYTSPDAILGSAGDFTTSPEISQLFGEICALYFVNHFRTTSPTPKAIRLIELGPGKGTLMKDMVRTLSQFPDVSKALKTEGGGIYFVEKGPTMRLHQAAALGVDPDDERTVIERLVERSEEEYVKKDYEEMDAKLLKEELELLGVKVGNKKREALLAMVLEKAPQPKTQVQEGRNEYLTNGVSEVHGVEVNWVSNLVEVPSDKESGPVEFIVAQELLDALPLHCFQVDEKGKWRERMVDVNREWEGGEEADKEKDGAKKKKDSQLHSARDYKQTGTDVSSTSSSSPLKLVLAPAVTPGLKTLLSNISPDGRELQSPFTPAGTVLEVSPEACSVAQDIASRVDDCGGAALIVDYGKDGHTGDSLRGFYRHTQVDVLEKPGEVDITADVDFKAVKSAVDKMLDERRQYWQQLDEEQKKDSPLAGGKFSPGSARVFGPVTQGRWLVDLGIVQRVEALIEQDDVTVETANGLFEGMLRLVEEDKMGDQYKVLTVVGGRAGKLDVSVGAPPGFT